MNRIFIVTLLAIAGCSAKVGQKSLSSSQPAQTVDFLNPSQQDIEYAAREEDNLKPLAEFGTQELANFSSQFQLSSGRLVTLHVTNKIAHFLPLHMNSVPMNFNAATLQFYQSFSEASFGTLDEATFGELKVHFWPGSDLAFSAAQEYSLKHFLTPVMQALMNRRGLISTVDCFSTAYARLVDDSLAHLILRSEPDFAFADTTRFETLDILDGSDLEKAMAGAKQLRFGDLLVFPGHITTLVTPQLAWEKANAGTTPFRLIDLRTVISFWSTPGGNVEKNKIRVYRPLAGLHLPKLDSIDIFNPRYGNYTEHAQKYNLRKNETGVFEPIL